MDYDFPTANIVNLDESHRVVATVDQYAEAPDHEEQWPVVHVDFRNGWQVTAINSEAKPYTDGIMRVLETFESDWRVLMRWIKIFYGAKHVEQMETQRSLYFVFDPEDLRNKYNIDAEDYNAESNVKAEAKVWESYFEGEVYVISLEERRTGRKVYDDGSSAEPFEEWEVSESVGGYYGGDEISDEALRDWVNDNTNWEPSE